MNGIVIGKRIPIGAAAGALITTLGGIFNRLNPDLALTAVELSGVSTAIVALIQIYVVNKYGVTKQ